MQDIHYELTRALVELGTLKRDFKSKPAFAQALTSCKEAMLDSYIGAISDALIELALLVKRVEFQPARDFIDSAVESVSNNFVRSFILSERKHSASRIYYLFHTFRGVFDKPTFIWVKKELVDHFFQFDHVDNIRHLYKRFSTRFFTLAELAVLYVSGLHIDCNSMKDEVYNDPGYEEVYGIKFRRRDTKEPCEIGTLISNATHEGIHLFMVPEFSEPMDEMLARLIKGHRNPEKLYITIDFKLYPSTVYTESMYKKYKTAYELFKSLEYINCEHIDFGEFRDKVNIKGPTFRESSLEIISSGRGKSVPKLGEILLKLEKINKGNLALALDKQQRDGGLIGEVLREFGITENDLADALSVQSKIIEER